MLFSLFFCLNACDDKEDSSLSLQNDCLKWTTGPHVAGLDIEFAYAMALPYHSGSLKYAEVEASIAGEEGTWMEHRSYHTDREGQADVGVLVGEPSVTQGARTRVDFTVDTCASTLRYYYRIPEAAKGKEVSFTFSSYDSNGQRASHTMGPYKVSQMDMALDLTLTRANCYISIEDMAVYNASEAALHPEKIDLVYIFRNLNTEGIDFLHSFVAPAADPMFLPDLTLPQGVSRDSKIRKGGPKDAHLGRMHLNNKTQPGIYVDDIDLLQMDMSRMPDYALNCIAEDGLWVETQDGKYRAYIYINSVRSIAGAVFSMKRIQLK